MLYVEPSAPGLFELDANMDDSNNGKLIWLDNEYQVEKISNKKFKLTSQELAGS
jgi:hypothetical protein